MFILSKLVIINYLYNLISLTPLTSQKALRSFVQNFSYRPVCNTYRLTFTSKNQSKVRFFSIRVKDHVAKDLVTVAMTIVRNLEIMKLIPSANR